MEKLSTAYEPAEVERRWYRKWRDEGRFAPDADSGKPPFTVVLPPPNVTGRLHMGHALTATIEDTMVRLHRMSGYAALWLPGTDHAGIATQVMVERQLASEGKSRTEVGREAFLERVWQWKEEHGGIIDEQHERLGASLDWDRYRFTMDEVSSRAVREAFCRLYEEGLVYRDYRLINWDWKSQTALSDLEVEHQEVDGNLWHLAYPVEGTDRTLIVATTRPETMLGDTGVAVHPDDSRYADLIGKSVVLPLTGRKIPIVGDSILVDMEFGTGAVKVTPAHDFNDFETGKRHDLDLICIVDPDGTLNDAVPQAFRGLDVNAARAAVVEALKDAGALVKIEEHRHNVGFSQRNREVRVEPLPSTQWFVKVAPMAAPALEAVRSGRTKIVPEHRTADYYRWMENIHDWCISRQLWWGHRIPAWHCGACSKITVGREDPSACQHCESEDLTQDEDVLDTWFSSGLWPLTTLGWPDKQEDLARFYPTSLMETGWDILFFWVARMMMFGLHFTGEVPFKTIYLHSMVLGEDGQKMSKTKGNVVDPVELIDAYGADALRYYLCTMAGQDAGIVFSRSRVEGYRHFCNKLWNASRFTLMNIEGLDVEAFQRDVVEPARWADLAIADRWILRRTADVALEVGQLLQDYRLDRAAHVAYQFVWYEFCDWYLEAAKLAFRSEDAAVKQRSAGALRLALDLMLRTLHPMIPFITEEIWAQLPRSAADGQSLMDADFPRLVGGSAEAPEKLAGPLPGIGGLRADPAVTEAHADMELVHGITTAVRGLRVQFRLPPGQRVRVLFRGQDPAQSEQLGRVGDIVAHLARLESFDVVAPGGDVPQQAAMEVVGGCEVLLPFEGLIDIDEERKRIDTELEKLRKQIEGIDRKLANEKFVSRAPEAVVAQERERRVEALETLKTLEAGRKRLG